MMTNPLTRDIFNVPNSLTLFRIALIPVFVVAFYLPFHWSSLLSAFIFLIAAITDYLDGLFARLLKQTSPLGAFLDPVADKLIVAVALVLLVGKSDLPFLSIPAAIIVGREIIISALREWMAELGKRTSVAVSIFGKLKTVLQMIAIILLLAYPVDKNRWLNMMGYIFLYAAAFMTLVSMAMYLKSAWQDLVASQSEV